MIYNIFFSLYTVLSEVLIQYNIGITAGGYLLFMIIGLAVELAVFGLYYTFRSIGLYKMAKNARLYNPARAIIPFYGIYYCSKLAPTSKYIKKTPSIFIIAMVCGGLYLLANVLLDAIYGIPAIFKLLEYKAIYGESAPIVDSYIASIFGFGRFFARILNAYNSISAIAYAVFILIAYRSVFMSYTMKNVNTFVLLSALAFVFTDSFLLAGIFIFALRNKPRINYDAYFEARRQWAQGYSQQNNPYGGNPYGGSPYGRPNNSQYGGNPYANNQPQQRNIDPFEEFSSNSSSSSNSHSNSQNNDDSDDFFN